MIKILVKKITIYTVIATILFDILACSPAKKINYFSDLPNAEVVNLPPITFEERVIEKGDILQISISARSSEAASYFNKGVVPPSSTSPSSETNPPSSAGPNSGSAYIVDNNGFLEFPIIGKIKAQALTSVQLKDNLTKVLTPYLKDALVEVNFTTFTITFLGAVGSAGTKTLPLQRTTLFEGLAAGGDLALVGKRNDILLYRDYKGERKIYRFDMRTKDVLNNPNIFQLRHNDVIYVQTRPGVIARDDIGFVWSIIGLVVGIAGFGFAIANNNN